MALVWEICSDCGGEGKSSNHLGMFTADDIEQMDPEFMEDYAHGAFDRRCEPCKGSGKVKVAGCASDSRTKCEDCTDYYDILAWRQEQIMEERMLYGARY